MTSLGGQEKPAKWVFLDGVSRWPFGDLELDEYEQEMEASIATGEWRSVPNLAEEIERARAIARATMATWSEEQIAEVRRRVADRTNGAPKPPPSLAGDGDKGDNPPQGDNPSVHQEA